MGDKVEKMELCEVESISCISKAEEKSQLSRNILVKKQMAEQLKKMGLSKDSVERILHL